MENEKPLYYNELALASLTIAILSFINLIGLERSITAIVFGILALKRIKQDSAQRGKNMAIAGIIIGVLYCFVAIAIMPHAIEMAKKIMATAR